MVLRDTRPNSGDLCVAGDLGSLGDDTRPRSDHVIYAKGRGLKLPQLHTRLRARLAHLGRDGIDEPFRQRRKLGVTSGSRICQILNEDILARLRVRRFFNRGQIDLRILAGKEFFDRTVGVLYDLADNRLCRFTARECQRGSDHRQHFHCSLPLRAFG